MISRNILLYSANGEDSQSFVNTLHDHDVRVREIKDSAIVLNELLTSQYQVVIVRCYEFAIMQRNLLKLVKAHGLPVGVIILAKKGSVNDAVEAMRMGALDFRVVSKLDAVVVQQILDEHLHNTPQRFKKKESSDSSGGDPQLIGESRTIQEVRSAICLVADSEAAVLITGESGTGKEIVARLIHSHSRRTAKPFVALNSAAIPKDVIENELFGHEKGAFTGALEMKQGAFEHAHGGTLFFDEIADMGKDTQAKVLRAIESKRFRRLGGKEEVQVDVRIIAATNKNIPSAIKAGEFREDLYYRFSVIEIALPPLRERREDIPLLAEHFLKSFALKYERPPQRFTDEAMDMLMKFEWAGNVRELQNLVERAVITCQTETIDVEHLPTRLTNHKPLGSCITIPIGSSFDVAEKQIILQTLASVHDNKSKAARILGLSRKTLHNKLNQFRHSAP